MQAFVVRFLGRMRERYNKPPIGRLATAGVSLARAARFPIVLGCAAATLLFGVHSARARAGAADRAVRAELRELFRIDGTDNELARATIGSIAVALAGRVYMTGPRTPRILVFDVDGRLFTPFGTKGEGPGDLDRPVLAFVTDNDELGLVHFRNGRIGERVASHATFDVGPGGRIYAPLERARYEVRVWNRDGRPLRTIRRRYKHPAYPLALHDFITHLAQPAVRHRRRSDSHDV